MGTETTNTTDNRWTDGLLWTAFTFLVTFALLSTLFSFVLLTRANAQEVDSLTRQIGLEMLRVRMIEQRQIDWTPPGYFLVGFTVRVG